MKTRPLFTALLFTLIAINADAQFSFGIKGSLTKAWQEYGDDFGGNGADLKVEGVSTSIMAYYRVGNMFAVGAEPGLVRRGATCEPGFFIENPYLTGDATLHANYIQLPVFGRLSKGLLNNRIEVSIKGGGGASWLASGYRELDLEWQPEPGLTVQDLNFEEEPNIKRWEAGLNGGAGVGVRIGPGTVLMEYEYYHALTDMNRQITSKNRSHNYSVGYWIDF